MPRDKLLLIADKLLERSRNGEADWGYMDEVDGIAVNYSGNILIIGSDNIAPDNYTLSAVNQEGHQVDSIELAAEEANYEIFAKLYKLAKRKAIGADETLDSLLQEI